MKVKTTQFLKFALGMFILVGIFEISKIFVSVCGIKFPAALLGMGVFSALLLAGILPPKWVESACTFLMRNMMFMFVPFVVGISSYREMLEGKILSIGSALLVSTILTMALTALSIIAVNLLTKKQSNINKPATTETKINTQENGELK